MCLDLVSNKPITSSSFIRKEILKDPIFNSPVKQGSIADDVVTIQVIQNYSGLITKGAGPCHVICVYGYNDKGTLAHLAMAHFSGWLDVATKGCVSALTKLGCEKFDCYVVGGDPTTAKLAKDLMLKFEFVSVVSPANEKDGDFINVTMYTDHIGFEEAS